MCSVVCSDDWLWLQWSGKIELEEGAFSGTPPPSSDTDTPDPMARTVYASMGLEDLFRSQKPLDLSDLAAALWSSPRASAEHDDFCDGLHVYPLGPCACDQLRKIRALHRPHIAATQIQALWRGYTTRQEVAKRNAAEVKKYTPAWRSLDDQYRMYVFCQTLMGELKKDDPTWDATAEPYYIWMMEHGPILEEWETFLRRRGWVRPKNKGVLNTHVFKRLINGVLESSGVPQSHWKTTMALYDTFVKTR
jgi:hypothetical protein